MAKIDKLIEKSKEHLNNDESIIAVVLGVYETKLLGKDTVRNGILIATDTRIVFYTKKLMGFELESFLYTNISSFEMSKGFMGYTISFFSSGNKVSMKWINEQDSREKNISGFVEFVRNSMDKFSAHVDVRVANDIPAQIKKLSDLKNQGILTEDEFTSKKQELLARL